jgi:hypothetical protein
MIASATTVLFIPDLQQIEESARSDLSGACLARLAQDA